jgi:hypothetical protein
MVSGERMTGRRKASTLCQLNLQRYHQCEAIKTCVPNIIRLCAVFIQREPVERVLKTQFSYATLCTSSVRTPLNLDLVF